MLYIRIITEEWGAYSWVCSRGPRSAGRRKTLTLRCCCYTSVNYSLTGRRLREKRPAEGVGERKSPHAGKKAGLDEKGGPVVRD